MQAQIFELQYALNTFYFLMCGALVMWMAAGFAMLEAGLVRAKNTTEILAKNIGLFAISCTMYLICGYYLMYDGNILLTTITDDGSLVTTALNASTNNGFHGEAVYSQASDFFFQSVFVATAMSIVSGAVAERMKLWVFFAFAIVMTGFIYPISGSWTWGGKDVPLIGALNFHDFAGGGIVHLAGATAAFAGILILGARRGKYGTNGEIRAIPGANLPLATLGTFILWMGWFGFNGGSVLKLADVNSAHAVAMVFLNTNAAAAGGAIGALVTARLIFGKADLTMLLNGALIGLVTITAEPLTPSPLLATVFGLLAGIIVVFSILAIDKLRLDDPVGALSVHGVGGLFGILLVPITNDKASLLGQLGGAAVIFGWVFISSFIVWNLLKLFIGIRIGEHEEYEGADISECGQEAYPEFIR